MEIGWFADSEWTIQTALTTRIVRGTAGSAGERMSDLDSCLVDLLAGVARGDVQAFAALYDATSRRVFGLARSLLGDSAEAEEAALEAYLYIWRHAARYDPGRGAPLQWLLVVTRSRAIDCLRVRMQRNVRERWDGFAALEDSRPGPEQACSIAEERSRVREALSQLPPEQREAIEVTYFEGLSHSEAAVVLGQPLGTVKSRIRAGLSSLRRCSRD